MAGLMLDAQLTDGGLSVTPELPVCVERSPFNAAPGSLFIARRLRHTSTAFSVNNRARAFMSLPAHSRRSSRFSGDVKASHAAITFASRDSQGNVARRSNMSCPGGTPFTDTLRSTHSRAMRGSALYSLVCWNGCVDMLTSSANRGVKCRQRMTKGLRSSKLQAHAASLRETAFRHSDFELRSSFVIPVSSLQPLPSRRALPVWAYRRRRG